MARGSSQSGTKKETGQTLRERSEVRVKVGDLVYWHEDAWLMQAGKQPKIIYGIVTSRYVDPFSPSDKCIWNAIRSDTGTKAIIHDSDLNVKVVE